MSVPLDVIGSTGAEIGTFTITIDPLFLAIGAVLTTLIVVILILRATAKRKDVL